MTSEDRFCSNCGTRLEPVTSQEPDPANTAPADTAHPDAGNSAPTPAIPVVGRKNAWEYERERLRSGDPDDEWSMSDLGPPPPRRKRTWLWVIIAILGFLVLSCCIFMYWIGYTDSGQDWFSGIATEAAEIVDATEEASASPAS
jgi:hypothetical protein